MYTYIHIHTHVYVWLHTYKHTYMIQTYIFTYIHTYIHTYICINTGYVWYMDFKLCIQIFPSLFVKWRWWSWWSIMMKAFSHTHSSFPHKSCTKALVTARGWGGFSLTAARYSFRTTVPHSTAGILVWSGFKNSLSLNLENPIFATHIISTRPRHWLDTGRVCTRHWYNHDHYV